MTYEQAILTAQPWATATREKMIAKMPHALSEGAGRDFIPYTVKDGTWADGPERGLGWWTNGFWPACLWQMYLMTGEEAYRAEAERAEGMLDAALQDIDVLHHDVGFMWLLSAGVNYRLSSNDASRKRVLMAAALLVARFNPIGFLRAWNGDRYGWSIIDSMMNLPLLYWATEWTGDPRFQKIAIVHADMAMQHFVRPDGSVNHIVMFDPNTMAVEGTPYGQGYADGSSWSRGQAWALYGYLLSYLHTKKPEYLATAKRIAHYFIANIQEDGRVLCDFRQPDDFRLLDDCAAAIAACGLLELAKAVPAPECALYFNPAVKILTALDAAADWTNDSPAIITHATSAYHTPDGHHIAMVYADSFFIEAVGKLTGEGFMMW